MSAAEIAVDQEPRLFAGLAGTLGGTADDQAPLILLHGLTFDRTMWRPALARLHDIDSGRRVLAVDLPGHSQSPAWPAYDIAGVTEAVHRAAEEARFQLPVLVGHSMSALFATFYAARYPVRGVINVDQWLRVEPMARLVQPLAGQIRGPRFDAVWDIFETSMHMELLTDAARELLRSGRNLRQDVVCGYWRELLDRPAAELADSVVAALAAVRAADVPYLFIAGHEVEPEYQDWLHHEIPQVQVTTWTGSGHFPHLADPGRFAGCLAATAQWHCPRES